MSAATTWQLIAIAGVSLLLSAAQGCSGQGRGEGTAVPSTGPSPTATAATTPVATPTRTATAEPTATATTVPTPGSTDEPGPADEPLGFPLDPGTVTGKVTGTVGSRRIEWGAGPLAAMYSETDQASSDPDVANASGWNCRVHVDYEGRPAVDWYIPAGTPIVATMDGIATLYAITTTNAFDYSGVSREPYLGNPDYANAPLSPFPGPGGGKGVFVEIESATFVTESAHLDLVATIQVLKDGAFLNGFSRGSDYTAMFAPMRGYLDATAIARWHVKRGEVIGYSGDSGYSEAPHLHYTVRRTGGGLLCPTAEAGFPDGGWLFRQESAGPSSIAIR